MKEKNDLCIHVLKMKRKEKKMFLVIDQRKSYMGVFWGGFYRKALKVLFILVAPVYTFYII